jgi:hypothetical protein
MGFDWYFGYFGLRLREKLGSNRVVEGLQDFGFEIPPVSTFNNREFDKLIHSFEKFIDGGYHKKTKSKITIFLFAFLNCFFFKHMKGFVHVTMLGHKKNLQIVTFYVGVYRFC